MKRLFSGVLKSPLVLLLALAIPLVGTNYYAFADTILVVSNTDWTISSFPGVDETVPWSGVSSLPDSSTFTLPSAAGAPHITGLEGATKIFSDEGVQYFLSVFELPAFSVITADIQLAVDNDVHVFINGFALALEGSLDVENYTGVPHRLFIDSDESVINGDLLGGDPFDSFSSTFPKSNWKVGTNEIILAVRNLSTGDDNGGFSFIMDIETSNLIPEVIIKDTIDDINALVNAGILKGGDSKSLTTKLNEALKELDEGMPDNAIKKLNDFIKKVNKLINKGTLPIAEGQALIDAVLTVIEGINVASAPAINPPSKLTTTWGAIKKR